ncbi:MAG: hypothetical protein IPJ32_21635 [Sphingobacteriaceae bacterium]|nr:hypothetical protein [Sphingobacteriaceae bacterium]
MKAPNNYDHYYLDPNRTKDPKESFKFIAEQIMPYLKTLTKPAIADIGCAGTKYPTVLY